MNFGDPDLLNDFVYQNYNHSVTYFDDDLEKTALYLDMLSRNENTTHYIRKTQNYELYSSQYLPLYTFRKFCSGARALNAFNEYPREIRSMHHEQKKFDSLLDSLLDVKSTGKKKKGFSKVTTTSAEDDERYKLD
jgi:hypothetical protein